MSKLLQCPVKILFDRLQELFQSFSAGLCKPTGLFEELWKSYSAVRSLSSIQNRISRPDVFQTFLSSG